MNNPLLRGNRGVALLPAILLAVVLGGVALGASSLRAGIGNQAGQAAATAQSSVSTSKATKSLSTTCQAGFVHYVNAPELNFNTALLEATGAEVPAIDPNKFTFSNDPDNALSTKKCESISSGGTLPNGSSSSALGKIELCSIRANFCNYQKLTSGDGKTYKKVPLGTGTTNSLHLSVTTISYKGHEDMKPQVVCGSNLGSGKGVVAYVKETKSGVIITMKQCDPGVKIDTANFKDWGNDANSGASPAATDADQTKQNVIDCLSKSAKNYVDNYGECQTCSDSSCQGTANEQYTCYMNGKVIDPGTGKCVENLTQTQQATVPTPAERPNVCTDANGTLIDSGSGNCVSNCGQGYELKDGNCEKPTTVKDCKEDPNQAICQAAMRAATQLLTQAGNIQPQTQRPGGYGNTFGGGSGSSGSGGSYGSGAQAACTISVSSQTVTQGQPVTLYWNATGNAASGYINGLGSVPSSGSRTVYPSSNTQYTMNVTDTSGNTTSCSTSVSASSSSSSCPTQPTQPSASSCSVGSWVPTYMSTGSTQCLTGWQCSSSGGSVPTASLSCQPQIADVGMSVALSWACGGTATASTGSNFPTSSALSGSLSTTITKPASGVTTTVFGLTCTSASQQTVTNQCTVQINQPSISFVASPSHVTSGASTSVGWVTSGMQACTVSSPDQSDFTARNANYQSVNGTATTSAITASSTTFRLHCTTLAGGTRDATTTVGIATKTNASEDIAVSSSADGATVNHGDSVTITWGLSNAPSSSAMSLWLIDVSTEQTVALIAGGKSSSGTYTWTIPATGSTCDTSSPNACASDLVAGHSYGIEAALYTPQDASLSSASGSNAPTYVKVGYTPNPFMIGN